MKVLVMMTAVWVLAARAEEVPLAKTGSVTVCMDPDFYRSEIRSAQRVASKIFETIGLKIDWREMSGCEPSENALQISLSPQLAGKQPWKAFAYALPYEGNHIFVFYDQVQKLDPQLRTNGLAYIMVHEVAHVLQAIARHSKCGIMKEIWDREDWFQIRVGHLRFAPEDVDLIYRGLAMRGRQLHSPTLMGGH